MMGTIKGYRLYVDLGASQTRKRLKHFGHGVRKVEAVGRNQSVIIHTATGEHLRELEAFLADVLPTAHEEPESGGSSQQTSDSPSPGAEEDQERLS